MGQTESRALGLVVEPGAADSGLDDERFVRAEQVLEPGYYWRAKRDVNKHIPSGDVLLLTELVEFEGRLHSVKLRCHPRHGDGEHKFLIEEFIDAFAPAADGEEVRAREQQAILTRVSELQEELVRTQGDPQLMLEATKPIVEAESSSRKCDAERSATGARRQDLERQQNLRKIHRRAARRSAAKGNPVALPKVAVGTNVSQLLTAGIDEGGVAHLREMADRQLVLAQAQANWLTTKTEEITRTLKQLAPFAAEKAAVALARSSDAISLAGRIRRGIESLDLYTGKGVDVFDLRDGPDAPTNVPLTLVQGKRFMEEELAAHADTDVEFDWRSQEAFFRELSTNDALFNQVMPTERCVVSMCVTRHYRHYGNAWQDLMNNLQNQLVFLLVRNGGKLYVVYSATPSHEAAHRLFPTHDELGEVFRGADGSKVSLRDVEFGEKSKKFDDLALHYRRFLILLCGLDHRLRLMGEFYPPEQQINFMSAEFQARYMRFYADDELGDQLSEGAELPYVNDWIKAKNSLVQSGSRVFVLDSHYAAQSSPEIQRRNGLGFVKSQLGHAHIVGAEGARFFVSLATVDTWAHYGSRSSEPNVKVYLNGEAKADPEAWWLCLDAVSEAEIRRYLRSRRHWSMGVGHMRLFRRLAEFLGAEAATEASARAYLLEQATTHGGMPEGIARPALDVAIRNWRAARRGAELPTMDDLPALNEVLSLIAPAGYVPPVMAQLLDKFILSMTEAEAEHQPILLTRSGANRYVLYTTAAASDKAAYPNILDWGWVRRVVVEPTKTARHVREVSSSLVWLLHQVPASEVELRRFEGLDRWLNKAPEPIKLRTYAAVAKNLADANEWAPVLRGGEGVGLDEVIFEKLLSACESKHERNESLSVLTMRLAIPVAAFGKPREISTVYMVARAERVLYFYGSEEQRAELMGRLSAHYSRAAVSKMVTGGMQWKMVVSKEEVDRGPFEVSKAKIAGAQDHQTQDWARHSIRVNRKRDRGRNGKPGVKGDGTPSHIHHGLATLSLNRVIDELAGVGPLRRRRFYQAQLESLKWLWSSRDDEERKAKRRKIMEARYEPGHACLSPLVWSEQQRRSVAQAVFTWPILRDTRAGTNGK